MTAPPPSVVVALHPEIGDTQRFDALHDMPDDVWTTWRSLSARGPVHVSITVNGALAGPWRIPDDGRWPDGAVRVMAGVRALQQGADQ